MAKSPLGRVAWLVIAGRLLTAFSEGIAALALVAIAVKQLGGVESGVVVATAAAVGMFAGSFAGGTLIPLLAELRGVTLATVCTVSGLSARDAAPNR